MKELSGRWAVIDPAATADWLNSQPPSAQVDPAIATFVSRIQGMDRLVQQDGPPPFRILFYGNNP